jgi:hypothetical protein
MYAPAAMAKDQEYPTDQYLLGNVPQDYMEILLHTNTSGIAHPLQS